MVCIPDGCSFPLFLYLSQSCCNVRLLFLYFSFAFLSSCVFFVHPSSSGFFFFLLLPGKEILTSMMEAFSISLSKNSLKSCNHFCTFHLSLYNMVNKFIAYTINSFYSQHKLEHLVLLVLKD